MCICGPESAAELLQHHEQIRVFESCSNLISVTLSNNLTNIPTNLFENAFSLTTIYYSGTAKGAPWGATNATIEANNTI